MKTLTFKTITDRKEAEKLWDMFSPHLTIDDEWEFRTAFDVDLDFPFSFIAGYTDEEPVGVLPLQRNTNKGLGPRLLSMNEPFLEFLGGVDCDHNTVLLHPDYTDKTHAFFEQIAEPAVLSSLAKPIAIQNNESVHYLDKFMLDLTKYSDYKTFLQLHFDGKNRQRLTNRINKLQRNYTVEIKTGTKDDLELLFQLSKDRFGERSSFHMSYRQQIYYRLLERFAVDIFTISLNGIPKAASYAIRFKDTYISLNMGYDYTIRDLGKLVFVTQLQRAMAFGAKLYDAGQGDNGWKEQMHLEKVPQYKLTLNVTQTPTEAT